MVSHSCRMAARYEVIIRVTKTLLPTTERGRELYEREAKQWPKPLGWDNLSEASRYLWSERAREKQRQQ